MNIADEVRQYIVMLEYINYNQPQIEQPEQEILTEAVQPPVSKLPEIIEKLESLVQEWENKGLFGSRTLNESEEIVNTRTDTFYSAAMELKSIIALYKDQN